MIFLNLKRALFQRNNIFLGWFLVLVAVSWWGSLIHVAGEEVSWEVVDKYFEYNSIRRIPSAWYITIERSDRSGDGVIDVRIPYRSWEDIRAGDIYIYPSAAITNWDYYFAGQNQLSDGQFSRLEGPDGPDGRPGL